MPSSRSSALREKHHSNETAKSISLHGASENKKSSDSNEKISAHVSKFEVKNSKENVLPSVTNSNITTNVEGSRDIHHRGTSTKNHQKMTQTTSSRSNQSMKEKEHHGLDTTPRQKFYAHLRQRQNILETEVKDLREQLSKKDQHIENLESELLSKFKKFEHLMEVTHEMAMFFGELKGAKEDTAATSPFHEIEHRFLQAVVNMYSSEPTAAVNKDGSVPSTSASASAVHSKQEPMRPVKRK